MLDRDGSTPLHNAVHSNQLNRVKHEIKCLKEQNKSLNFQNNCGRTSLLLASFAKDNNTTNIVKLLVEAEADVNISDDMKVTPLHAACRTGKLEVAEILLQAGARINAQTIKYKSCDTPHNTSLHLAVHYKNYKQVNLLLDAGADANIPNYDKEIPLFCTYTAKSFNYFDDNVIEKLISATSITYLNSTIPSMNTILHVAIETNNIKLVSILIQYGAKLHSSINYDPNPIWFAAHYGRPQIFKMILKVVNIEKCNEDERFWPDLLNWAFDIHYPGRVECLCYVMKISRVILDPKEANFYFLVKYVTDDNFLEVDVIGITKMLFQLGAVMLQEDLEGLICLCCRYRRHNCTDREIELLDLFMENNVDVNEWNIYYSVVNYPELTLKLLQYCIRCDPIDIFKHILKCKRKPDVPLLNLIKNVLRLCSPYCGLRFKRFLHLQSIKNKDLDVRSTNTYSFYLNKLQFPWYACVLDSEIDNELCEEVLDLLYRYRVPLPTLVELSRNKIRKQLRLSCKDTKNYLQNLKSLQLPRIIIDIIQCKANIIK